MKKENKRVVLLIDSLGAGGAQRQITMLARELAERYSDVALLYYKPDRHMLPLLAESSVNVREVYAKGGRVRKILAVLRVLTEMRPAVLISFIDAPNQIALLYKIFHRTALWIAGERNHSQGSGPGEVVWRRIAYRFADFVVPNSEAQVVWLQNNICTARRKIKLIENCVRKADRPRQQYATLPVRLASLSIGRLAAQKNPLLLLDLHRLLAKQNEFELRSVWHGEENPGDDLTREELNGIALSEGLSVSFYEAIPDPFQKCDDYHFLVLCSRFEGTPNVVLEAMAAGMIVIGPAIPSVSKHLGSGRGLLFEPGNASDLLAKIRELAGMTTAQLNSMAESARVHVQETCSPERIADLYAQLIDGANNGGGQQA